jgi:hypothetical protein
MAAAAAAQNVSGRVTALAYSPDVYADKGPGHTVTPALFLGAAGGGIWRWRIKDPADNNNGPVWSSTAYDAALNALNPSSQAPGAINLGAIAVDPNHPNVIYAGTGEANYTPDSGYRAGVLRSTEGSAVSWVRSTAESESKGSV